MAKVRLNQIVALNAPKKADTQKVLGTFYHICQKPEPFFGLERTYTPKDDNGEALPSENKKVQLRIDELLNDLKSPWIDMFDVVLTNDAGNCVAKADIVIDDVVLLKEVPVSTLLFLEKRLEDWKNVLDRIPVLPLAQDWAINQNSGLFETPVVQKFRTNKIEVPLIVVAATDKHPAQAKTVVKDVNVGTWSERALSSALPLTRIEQLKKNLSKFREAVIKARENANSTEIEQKKGGEVILDYLFK